MKKFLGLLAFFILFCVLFVMSVSAAGTFWTFDDEASALAWADRSANGGTVGYEDGSLVIYVSDAGDPYFQHGLTPEEQFDAAAFPFVKIKYKVIGSDETLSEFFWGSSVTPGPVAETNYQFSRKDSEEWVEYVEKIRDTSFGTWEGIIDNFRIDPIQGAVDGTEVVYVDYIAFFATEEEALAWQPAVAVPPSEGIRTAAADIIAGAVGTDTAARAAAVHTAPQTEDLFTIAIIVLAIASGAFAFFFRKGKNA